MTSDKHGNSTDNWSSILQSAAIIIIVNLSFSINDWFAVEHIFDCTWSITALNYSRQNNQAGPLNP